MMRVALYLPCECGAPFTSRDGKLVCAQCGVAAEKRVASGPVVQAVKQIPPPSDA